MYYCKRHFHKATQPLSLGLVYLSALHFPENLSSFCSYLEVKEGKILNNATIIIYLKLLMQVNTCNFCISLKIFCDFGKTIFSEKFPMKEINYFSKPIQYLIHIKVECSAT